MQIQKSLRIPEQSNIPIALPIVKGNQDYHRHKELLERIDRLLTDSGIEVELQESALVQSEKEAGRSLRASERLRIQQWTTQAMRCNIARILSQESFRSFAFHLGESHLLQQFCRLIELDRVHVPSKSTLQAYSEAFGADDIRQLINIVNQAAQAGEDLGLAEGLDLSVALMDSTCVELMMHFPVDWVLLRDVVRTLTKAIECIRRHGLKTRIKDPVDFRSQMNRYCIAMTQAKRGAKARKERKRVLRLMKKLSRCVSKHAERYRALLLEKREETGLSERQAQQIIKRIDNVLAQLPDAITQAHERIIGERLVPNDRKILSLYESHAQVYHRGKAGKPTEFGLQLLVAESMDGLIVDWDLVDGAPKNDTQHLKPCIKRLQAAKISIANAVGDRGFASAKNSAYLDKQRIGDQLCPRNVIDLQQRLQDESFVTFQKRRAQTEARIGILKNRFIGQRVPVKGYIRQKKHMAWSVLSHNLWLLARRLADQEQPIKQAA
jgi:hypothetical protein